MTQFLIFANGKPKAGAMVRLALREGAKAHRIAADGGARVAWYYGLSPEVVIGDMDSLSPLELQDLADSGAKILRYPAENETDLELALLYAAEQGATWIRIIGAVGGRFDQMLANVYLLALPQLAHCDTAIVARKQLMCLFSAGEHNIQGKIGDTVSLIPISGDVSAVHTTGLQYPLKDDTLRFGAARGISNVMTAEIAQIHFETGRLLLCPYEGQSIRDC